MAWGVLRHCDGIGGSRTNADALGERLLLYEGEVGIGTFYRRTAQLPHQGNTMLSGWAQSCNLGSRIASAVKELDWLLTKTWHYLHRHVCSTFTDRRAEAVGGGES